MFTATAHSEIIVINLSRLQKKKEIGDTPLRVEVILDQTVDTPIY